MTFSPPVSKQPSGRRSNLLWLLSAAIIISGCLQKENSNGEVPEWETSSGNHKEAKNENNNTINGGENNKNIIQYKTLGLLQLDNCQWIQFNQDFLPGTNPAPIPQEWGQDSKPFSTNVLRIYKCSSFAVDELDRPATLLMEVSNHGSAPDACRDYEGPTNLEHILTLAVDDPVVQQALADRYHAPVELASFSVETTDTGTTWSWNLPNGPSRIDYQPNLVEDEVTRTPSRLVWPTPNGTMVVDLTFRGIGPDFTSRAAIGTLGPDHYMGVEGRYAGFAGGGSGMTIPASLTPRGPGCEPLE